MHRQLQSVSRKRGRAVKVKISFSGWVFITKFFLDREKTLIMKIRLLHTGVLLLAVMTLLAGCSGSRSAPATGMAGQPGPLSDLLLEPSEIPFMVMDEKTTNQDLAKPEFMLFHAARGITRISSSEKTPSPATVQMGQTIIEYPPGNATPAFVFFKALNRQADQSRYKITWLPDPGIGNQSCAFIVADRSGAENPKAMIVFQKSVYMESVVMSAPELDTGALIRAARAAAAKIR